MTLDSQMASLRSELLRSGQTMDVRVFVADFFPHDIEAGQLLTRAFDGRFDRFGFLPPLCSWKPPPGPAERPHCATLARASTVNERLESPWLPVQLRCGACGLHGGLHIARYTARNAA